MIGSFFTEFKYADDGIRVADGRIQKVEGIGSGQIKCIVDKGKVITLSISDVLYVPTFDGNLLSVRKLYEKGIEVSFNKDCCRIKKGNDTVALACASHGLYSLSVIHEAKFVQLAHSDRCQHTWHRRFGHRNIEAIKKLSSEGLATGIHITDCGVKLICESCLKGKMFRKPFPKESRTITNKPLELIYTDICGPMHVQTPGKKRYVLTIIDDFSRYTHIHLLKMKSDATKALQEYIAMVQTKFGRSPEVIRSDRGGEYISKEFKATLKKAGVQMQMTAPYSPQQNGVAERKNRSLVEMTRCMLHDAKLSEIYWGEAINTANYLQNRLPTKGTLKTPYRNWEMKQPDVENLRMFGCVGYVHIPKEKRRKLDMKAEKLIFVGYAEGTKAYRMLDPKTCRITISRDVQFVEVETKPAKLKEDVEIYLERNPENERSRKNVDTEESIKNNNREDSYEGNNNDEIFEDAEEFQEENQTQLRRSERNTKGKTPARLCRI